MRVLIGCEFSGVVRRVFRDAGHLAYSCDLLPAEDNSPYHFQGDIFEGIERARHTFELDLLIAHPPCTHLAVSGARWFKDKANEQIAALAFVQALMDAPVPRICIENPISVISSKIRKPDQIVQPHWFGEPYFKATCLWLKGLPKLTATNPLKIPLRGTPEWTAWNKVHRQPPGPDRWKERSRTYNGFALAMASQWGEVMEQAA